MFNFKKHMEKMEKFENDYVAEQKKELAKRKRAVNISTAVTVGKAIGSAFVTGVCTQVAINTIRNEEASNSVKATAVTAAIISIGLQCDNTYKAFNAISSQGEINRIHKGTLNLIDLVGEIKAKTESVESESETEDTESNIIKIPFVNPESETEIEVAEKITANGAALDTLIESTVDTLVEQGAIRAEERDGEKYLYPNEKFVKLSEASPIIKHESKKNKESN